MVEKEASTDQLYSQESLGVIPFRLLLFPTAPIIEVDDNTLVLDVKFVEGLRLICREWPGEVKCILRCGAEKVDFGRKYRRNDLPCKISVWGEESVVSPDTLSEIDIVLATGDNHLDLDLARIARRSGSKIVYAIEYIHETRQQIMDFDETRSVARRIYGKLWEVRQELRRHRAFRIADGIQANGYPAFNAYRSLNHNSMRYLDNRMHPDILATQEEMSNRFNGLLNDQPLRLINSGRLEPMKGAQDLVPLARELRVLGVDFSLTIFGIGSLVERMQREIIEHSLSNVVQILPPVDFESELVPFARQSADIFVSCHRQSDPSCSYLEAMGCGLPVIGYDNRMLKGLLEESGAGWSVRLGDVKGLARRIASLQRPDIVNKGKLALSFSRQHDFFQEFAKRLGHLQATLLGGR